ncbi:hypothetical protein HXX76_002407 [Chlamydomonas incerta]|uniref:Protein-L-isoaspartate O-methyltransferase n=1 Tax=Chlamydomonas incerta TaxID=51695 RepID=A0A835TDZ0_CHLIN|nr:hypothetical protein HXX76_002407 [Chlamydomonas incerta]|eukprot:KAG2442321.1 hypothetical protein HXX76_002407 [Chlamydomonas incerta]
MDLEGFVANRELLERLSREYELLKASGAEVDYAAWVRQRLREAAADLAASAAGVDERQAAGGAAAGGGSGASNGGSSLDEGDTAAQMDASGTAANVPPPPPQLSFSRFQAGYTPHDSLPLASLEMQPGSVRPETAWFLRGEAEPAASQALTAAIYGRTSTALVARGARKSTGKRVTIVSPQRSPATTIRPASGSPGRGPAAGRSASTPAHMSTTIVSGSTAPPHAQHTRRQSSPPQVSKLYTAQEPGLFTSRPDAYVHPQARPRRATSPAAKRPDWVNAASLQAALRGASAAVPHLQAAAERERRLALSSAMARQSLAAGLSPDDARAAALYGVTPGAAAATAAQYDHVLAVAAQLAAQNEQLARAVQENSAALAAQQAVLQTALQPRPGGANADEGGEAGGAAGAGPRVEVEKGPPAWFSHPGRFPAAGKGGAKGKGTTRATSPGHLPAGATSKERDRANRKEALKKLLKQVLGGAGLSGGEEGQRRLASGMEEAEKLVAAIQALARVKRGAGAGREGEDKGVGAMDGHGAGSGEVGAGPGSAAGTRPGSMRSLAEAVAAAAAAGGGAGAAACDASGTAAGSGDAALGTADGLAAFEAAAAAMAAAAGGAGAGGPGLGTGMLGSGGGGGTGLGLGTGTGRHPLAPGGIIIESLEDQVADIVQRDAAAYTEAARLSKIDTLEQRLNLLVDNVEGRLGRLLGPAGPLAATAQQLAALQLAGGAGGLLDEWEVVLGPDGQPLLGPDGRPVLRRKGTAAGGAGPGGGPLSPRSAGLSVLELQKMLIAINRMESKETEIRRKWFVDTQHPRPRPGPGTQPIYARDGWVGTLDPDQPQPGPEALAASAAAAAAAHGPASAPSSPSARPRAGHPPHPRAASASPHRLAPGDAARWPGFAAPPTESVMATVDAASSAPGGRSLVHFDHRPAGLGGGGAGAGAGSGVAVDGTGESVAADADPISDALLEAVVRGRRRYLRAQQLADGDLVAAADPELNPVQVMEDVTDALLDDLLRDHARELLGWCDKVAEHIYDDEFDLEGLSGGLEAAAAAGGLDGLGKRAAGLGARRGGGGGENDPARAAALMRLRGKAAAGAGGGGGGGGGGAAGAEGGGAGLAPGHAAPGGAGPGPGGGAGRVAPGMTALLSGLVARGTLRSERVAAAMAAMDRAAFTAPGYGAAHAYEDRPLPIGYDQTISAPHMHATALELLLPKLRPGARVLDVGSGSGYLTACLGLLVAPGGRVLGVETVAPLAERSRAALARVVPGLVLDGTVAVQTGNVLAGLLAAEPGGGACWDAIHVGAAAEELPRELVAALAPGGRMVVPVGPHGGYQVLTVVDKAPAPALAAGASGGAAAHGLAPQGPGGGATQGEEAGAAAPTQEQPHAAGVGKQPAEAAVEEDDWMRGIQVTQVMGVGYVPLGGRAGGTLRRSSVVVPGGALQDCCIVAGAPVSPTASGSHTPVSARRLPSRASSFLGLLPTQRASSTSVTAAVAGQAPTPYSHSSSPAAAASLAAPSRPAGSTRPAVSPVTLASQAQWGGTASSSPAAAPVQVAASQAWTQPAAPAGPDSSRRGSITAMVGGSAGCGGGLPAVVHSAGYRRASVTDELLLLVMPDAAAAGSGAASPVPPAGISLTAAGSASGSSKFRRVQRLLVPPTTAADGCNDMLDKHDAHAAGLPPQSPVPVSPAAAGSNGLVSELPPLALLAPPQHAAAAGPPACCPEGMAGSECGAAPSSASFARAQQLLPQHVKASAQPQQQHDLPASPAAAGSPHAQLRQMALVDGGGGGARPLSAPRRSSLVILGTPEQPPHTSAPAQEPSQPQAAQAQAGSPGFRRVRRPPCQSKSFCLISTSSSYSLSPTPPPSGPLNMLGPQPPSSAGGVTADGGLAAPPPLSGPASSAAPAAAGAEPQEGGAAGRAGAAAAVARALQTFSVRPPPGRRMSFRVGSCAAAAPGALSLPGAHGGAAASDPMGVALEGDD